MQVAFAGKFTEDNLPKGPRGATINKERVAEVQPLLGLMRDIGSAHGGKTPGQVKYPSSKAHVSWHLPDLQLLSQNRNRPLQSRSSVPTILPEKASFTTPVPICSTRVCHAAGAALHMSVKSGTDTQMYSAAAVHKLVSSSAWVA